ncbi:MAG TPA: metallophosphoesterase [Verrucomicrobiota bacterium]|nr:metallophosphoesterase [Verrucomicrobiota bacterium]
MARSPAQADDVALVGIGETWKYWRSTSEPPVAWNQPIFDDAAWQSGDSGFGVSSWGENTLFDGLERGSGTVYFRKAFTVHDPGAVDTLTLRCDWEGGFVAFLNGTEIARRNLAGWPGTPVPFTAEASPHSAGVAEDILLINPSELVHAGTNVLAIQAAPAHGFATDVVLVPELLANFTRGPYLQSVLSDRATVLWRTPIAQSGRVEFGTDPDLADAQSQEALLTPVLTREVTLTGLQPGTRYYYRVRLAHARSPIFSFRTLPASGDLDFLVLGDSGAGSAAQFAIARHLSVRSPDLIVQLGDIVYPYFSFGRTDTRCLSVYRSLLRTTPFYFAWGNHDLYGGTEPYRTAFRVPTNDTPQLAHVSEGTLPEFYYSFDAGDAHFAVLFWPYSSQYYMRENCPQLQWLEADLAASSKPWKFLCLHHPVNTSGGHRNDDLNFNRIPDRNEVAARLMPLARKYGVQMIFSGHDHNFERFHPIHRTHTVVSGGGGIILYGLLERDTNSAAFFVRWHFTSVQLRGDTLRLVATDAQGVAFDALEFRRTREDSADPDGDGLGPAAEAAAGSRPDSPDTDGDGRNDGWEWVRGYAPTISDATEDSSHLTAFLHAPLPRPPAEIFPRQRLEGSLELRWLGLVNHRAILESAASADAEWEPIPSFLAGGPLRTDRQSFVIPPYELARFFRRRFVPEQ